jgi:hypothetical protein
MRQNLPGALQTARRSQGGAVHVQSLCRKTREFLHRRTERFGSCYCQNKRIVHQGDVF